MSGLLPVVFLGLMFSFLLHSQYFHLLEKVALPFSPATAARTRQCKAQMTLWAASAHGQFGTLKIQKMLSVKGAM